MSAPAKLTSPTGKRAELFRNTPGGRVQCTACARLCQIGEGQVGLCGVRGVVGGELYLLNYGKIITGHIDPIEKKPVTHYKPGSKIFSIATTGCNWLCRYCFSPGMSVLTDQGIKTVDEIFANGTSEGEVSFPDNDIRVLTHEGRFKNVLKVFKHDYHGKMMKIRPFYLPEVKCTPNHNLYVFDEKSGSLKKKRADELRTTDFLAIPKTKDAITSESIDCLPILANAIPKIRRTSKRSSLWRVKQNEGRLTFGMAKSTGIPRSITLNPDFAELMGTYCAEGSCTRAKDRPNSWTVNFSFGNHETGFIQRTEDLLFKVFGLTPRRVRQGPELRLDVTNSAFAVLLKELAGANKYVKRVPETILYHESKEILRAFLDAYLRGDGFSTGAKQQRWFGTTSVSKELTLGTWYLMSRLGLLPRFYVSENSPSYEIQGRTVSRHNDYVTRVILQGEMGNLTAAATKMREMDAFTLVPIRKISSEEYKGPVFNMEVEGDHSYSVSFLAVSNCQNSDISQRRKVEGIDMAPADVVRLAAENGCEGIAYTYNEPSIFIEYARDVGVRAHEKGIFNIFVSNGFDTPESVGVMGQFLDCLTVDFKGSGETDFVRKYIGVPDAQPIFETLLEVKSKTKIHTEITDLVVPGVGDNLESARKLSKWVYDNLGPDTPIHFLRFHPDYKMMDIPVTPVKTLEAHLAVAKEEGLRYVYIGNVPGHPAENTYCPGCGKVLIDRSGYELGAYNLDKSNRCVFCGYKTPIIGPLSKSAHEERFRLVVG